MRGAGHYDFTVVGEWLLEFAQSIDVPLKLQNGKIKAARKEIKRKARNYNLKMQGHRGVHKKKYPNLWTSMVVVLSKTSSKWSLDNPTTTGLAETLIKKFEDLEPDYRGLYGMELRQWIKEALEESKRRQILAVFCD
ncbi:hypothetical protein B0I72DRAFT_35544 [Yarrowia lipolytica]|jgi:hypothetical protein|uniref:Uncharacterized protein n=1 Tax=Yarrowia lipolytica TaxID=4952 RepID=A0A371C7C6_YARLL|nr:hypothetical protein BKA91DRAFT_36961 [Yarrowia lipolytica]KAE8172913.1 hypothetical protein BKA90DRAFT_13271 [Yarrowia lipolytica]RDW25900.1 hypothetical protein B0I71DRAFT_36468 [Yarrowia lipolytica]RDW32699.1 hypothetical protein B0I72DRAFT_35544 [Yarrowia lipolytica]RDW38036.1 hypothetical protein B0I73DRAFT_48449 [Yarrowia lipolytica]